LALAVPLSRFTSRVGGGSAFFVRHHYTLMKIIPLLTLVFLLTACNKTQSDTAIRQKLIGTWKIDSQPITFTFNSDGRWSSIDTAEHKNIEGSWLVESGYYILTVSNTTTAKSYSQRFKVVHISDHDFSSRWSSDTNQLTSAHKQ
jgi:hypothetical protein